MSDPGDAVPLTTADDPCPETTGDFRRAITALIVNNDDLVVARVVLLFQ
jgi:hypothetical protein